MKITLTLEEALKILKEHVLDKTSSIVNVKGIGAIVTHIERYSEEDKVAIDGFEFEIEG